MTSNFYSVHNSDLAYREARRKNPLLDNLDWISSFATRMRGRGGMSRGRGGGGMGMKTRPPFIPHVPFDIVLAEPAFPPVRAVPGN